MRSILISLLVPTSAPGMGGTMAWFTDEDEVENKFTLVLL